MAELDKIAAVLPADGVELSIRFRTETTGAAYDFGTKFGASEPEAAALTARAAALGFTPSLTFHPGTQCRAPEAWRRHIAAAGRIARAAGVRPARLNVGGGFPSSDADGAPELETYFDVIAQAAAETFGADAPALVCEPGRGLVACCMALACRVKLVREDGAAFLTDGIYGGFSEAPSLGAAPALRVFDADGAPRRGPARPRVVFGPTCDSLDRLPGAPLLPDDIAEGDHVLAPGVGAYAAATATRFNGYGPARVEVVEGLGDI